MSSINPKPARVAARFRFAFPILVGGLALSAYAFSGLTQRGAQAQPPSPEDLKVATSLSRAFQQVAKMVEPSLVSISAVKKPKVEWRERQRQRQGDRQRDPRGGGQFDQFLDPEFFERFFGEGGPGFGFGNPGDQEMRGMGSGFIISTDGLIITNNHVVAGADELEVSLNDGRKLIAKVVGTDPKTDIALIQVDAKDLPAVPFGDSDTLEVGEWVLALGAPFGLEKSVTAGIVSAKGRSTVGIADYEDFIQTDAAINPGNSGGPLVNLEGKVIGINTAIASRSGGSMGIGFAIPSAMAQTIVDSLRSNGKVTRGFLGIMIQDLTPEMAESFGYKGTEGVLVGDVTADGPAAGAGLRDGDIVTAFDGRPMKNSQQLRNTVANTPPGTEAPITLFRDGKEESFKIKIGELPSDEVVAVGANAPSQGSAEDNIGLMVKTLTPELAARLGDENMKGVMIEDVIPGSPAAEAGLQANEVIVKAGSQSVETVEDLQKALKEGDLARGIRLQVESNKTSRFVFLKADE